MGEADKTPPRTAWIDVARGICIILVVFMHFDELHFSSMGAPPLPTMLWDTATSAMRPARMPAFFMISGILAAHTIQGADWTKALKRVRLLGYLYVLWATIYLTVFYFLLTPMTPEYVMELLVKIPMQAVWPSNQIWYLYALIAFLVVARLARSHYRVLIIASIVLSVFHDRIDDAVAAEMARCAVFYLVGAFYRDLIASLIGKAKIAHFVASGLAYTALILPMIFFPESVGLFLLPAAFAGVFLVCQISTILVGTPMKNIITYIGKNTLPIYVMHSSILLALSTYSLKLEFGTILATFPFLVWIYPIFGNAAVIGACLLVGAAIKQARIEGVLSLPATPRIPSLSRSTQG